MRNEQGTAISLESGPRFSSGLAVTRSDVIEAQRLRYRVFAEEMGARLPHSELRLDRDRFDPYCDHLLVRDDDAGIVVGTYRMLPAREARKVGGFCADALFDLGPLARLPALVEIGRACVHPDYRTGSVLRLLWAGLASYLLGCGFEHAIGCASIFVGHDRESAARACRLLLRDHLVAPEWRVDPRTPFALGEGEAARPSLLPPLIRGYLHLGAEVCGAPSHDPEFGTADVLIMLSMDRLDQRRARRLLRT